MEPTSSNFRSGPFFSAVSIPPEVSEKQLVLPDGGVLGYSEFGDPAGRPVFFLHGWPSSKVQALPADASARELGLRLIAVDRPGIGASSPASDRSPPAVARRVGALADALGLERFGVLGVSGGAPHAHACAHCFPERVVVNGICCGVPPPEYFVNHTELHPVYRILITLQRSMPWAVRIILEVARIYIQLLPANYGLLLLRWLLPPPDRRALRGQGAEWAFLSARDGFRQGTGQVAEDARTYLEPWGFDPAASSVPTHFWHGERDRNIPLSSVRPLLKSMLHARVTLFEEEAHYSLPLNQIHHILRDLRDAIRPHP